MAELRFRVKADYEELGKLRTEIQRLKEDLRKTGANTDTSAVKAIEAQLATLTRQYEALTKKIAEAEAQYDMMAKKMTDKAKEIARAQDQLTAGPQANASPQQGVDAPAVDQSVEAQAKAYEELKKEIDAIAGSKTNLIKQMLDEQNAIRLINAELKQISTAQKENGIQTQAQKERVTQLNASLLNHKEALSEVRQSLSNYVKLENAASGSMNELSQSLGRMRMVYRTLSEEERNSPFGQELLASIQQADAKIKELDATIGNHQRNVGNYGQAWNGLGNSIQQLARELPSLANGPRVFFSAISNNLPILADEIKRARTEYDKMVKNGEKGVPVWKQIGASIVSWQTALTVGITLLTMYGDKIVEWGKDLLDSGNGMRSTEKATSELNKAMDEGAEKAAKAVVELRVMEKIARDVARSEDERNNAARRVLETLGETVNATNIAKVLNGEYAESVNLATKALIKQAQAQAAMEKLQERYAKTIRRQNRLARAEEKGVTGWQKLRAGFRSGILAANGQEGVTGQDIYDQRIEHLKKKAEDAQEDFDAWAKEFMDNFSFEDIEGKTPASVLQNYLTESLAEIARITKMEADALRDRARSAKDMEFMAEQARIDAMRDGAEKVRAQRTLDNRKELENLERQKEDYIRQVVEQEKAIFEAKENQRAKEKQNYTKQSFDSEAARAKVDTTAYDNAIALTQEKQKWQQDEVLKTLLDQYKSYEDKKQEIIISYLEESDELQAMYEETGDERYKRSLEERHKAYVKATNDLEQKFGTTDYKLIFGDPEKMTSATIEKALEAARKKMSQLDKEADPETFKALSEAIDKLEDARDNNPFEGWGTSLMDVIRLLHQIRNIRKDIAKYEAEGNKEAKEGAEAQLEKSKKNLAKALVGTGVATFGDTLSKAAASMREVAEASGDIDLMAQAEALEKAGGFISSVASGAASGGWVGAIIGGASSLMDMLISSITKSKTIAAEAKKAYEDYLDELARSARQIDEKDYETIFGIRALDKVIAASKAAQKAWDDYQKAMDVTSGNPQKPDFISGLENMLTGDGARLKEKYKEIFTWEKGPRGQYQVSGIDLEEAEKLLKIYEGTEEANSNWYKSLQDAVNALKDYQDNVKIMDDYLTSLFSNVGSEIADAIMQGNDALEVLEKNAGQIFKSIAKEMIMSVLIGPEFIEKYKKMLRDAIATSGAEDDAAVLEGFVDELSSNIEEASEKWEEIKRIAEEKGIDMFGDESGSQQSASRKGYETLSEDTGSELAGRALAQYESNLRIEEATRGMKDSVDLMASNYIQMKNIADESRSLIANSYLELQQIRDNTRAIIKPIQNLSDKIDGWDSYIKNL